MERPARSLSLVACMNTVRYSVLKMATQVTPVRKASFTFRVSLALISKKVSAPEPESRMVMFSDL